MSVILRPHSWPAWFGKEPADPAQLEATVVPPPVGRDGVLAGELRIGNVKNNDLSLIEPIAA
jgi:hypothetical protein